MYRYSPGLAADLAVFDIALNVAASWVDAHRVGLAAIWARDVRARVGSAVAQRKIAIEIGLVRVITEAS